uniref:Uncharacterized protein n=1 Tax=Anguilla anguilla TaxID=7936 RepID=A0A0E9UJC9_ANGAN
MFFHFFSRKTRKCFLSKHFRFRHRKKPLQYPVVILFKWI